MFSAGWGQASRVLPASFSSITFRRQSDPDLCRHMASLSSNELRQPSDIQWNPSIKATQNGGLSKEVACHEG